MDTPGLDVEPVTGMVGGGAQVVVFTTGLGTPTGNPIAPVIKITGNRRHRRDDGRQHRPRCQRDSGSGESIDAAADRLLDEVRAVCSGKADGGGAARAS